MYERLLEVVDCCWKRGDSVSLLLFTAGVEKRRDEGNIVENLEHWRDFLLNSGK